MNDGWCASFVSTGDFAISSLVVGYIVKIERSLHLVSFAAQHMMFQGDDSLLHNSSTELFKMDAWFI